MFCPAEELSADLDEPGLIQVKLPDIIDSGSSGRPAEATRVR